jgi:AGZA family xanthine/uracil permease-like MFS transporter
MDNVESAEAAGDSYSTTEALAAEGTISLIGTLMGSPFANAVYIGHPGWKSMGGRIGYSVATGVFVLCLAWFGILAVFLNLVPVVAISPILLYIGMLIGAQAFQTTPMKHAPAIILALVPHLAAWAKTLIDGALGAAGVAVDDALVAGMAQNGVLYQGLGVLGNGAILTGLVLAAIGVFIIERRFEWAAAFALGGAVLTFFGFMHGPAVGFGVTPSVAFAYALVAAFLYACGQLGWVTDPADEVLAPEAQPAE